MYEKKINLFNSVDREIMNNTFKYNVCFFIILLLIFFSLFFIKINNYYENNISFINDKNAVIIIDKNYLERIKNNNKILLNDVCFDFNIDKIEEIEKGYLININFESELNLNTSMYKIYLDSESLFKFIVETIKGEWYEKSKWFWITKD